MLQLMGEMLEPGMAFAGKYRLERQLGAGGMGAVWAAVDGTSGAIVALKVLHPDRVGDAKDRARFLREARLAMAVRHPNVATVHAVGETESGTPFLVMDLLEGESFRALLKRRLRLEPDACARIFVGIVAGVRAAHVMGIVHRDLKPENVFLVGAKGAEPDASRVRVLDFGVAKKMPATVATTTASASLTSTGAVVGTPRYMAPEQIYGAADLDARADVWALGVMLFESLTGVRPTDGGGFGEILRRVTVDPLPTLRSVRPDLPATLDLVDHMLSRPRERRPSLDQIAAMLATIEKSPDNTTRPVAIAPAELAPTRVAPLAPPRRRSFFAFGAIAIVLLVAGGLTLGQLGRRGPSSSAAAAPPSEPSTFGSARATLATPSATPVWAPPATTGRLKDVTYERTVARLTTAGWVQSKHTPGEQIAGGGDILLRSVLFLRGLESVTVTFYVTSSDWARHFVAEKGLSATSVEDPPVFLSVAAASPNKVYDLEESKRVLEIILGQ